MGAGMAASLLKASHDVTVYNRTRTKVEAVVAQGTKAAASVSDACSGDAVIPCWQTTTRSRASCSVRVVHRQPARRRNPYFLKHDQYRPIGEA